MPSTQRPTGQSDAEARQPPRSDAPADAEMQAQDTGTPASGEPNRGSPAAPVMKQFQKTEAESGGPRQ